MLMTSLSKQNANDYESLCQVSVPGLWTVDELKGRGRAPGSSAVAKILISAASLRALHSQRGSKEKMKTRIGVWFWEKDYATIVFFLIKYILDSK